ncbi:MAG: hypothetical protein AAGD92_08345 [Pseudomonadota bacterium]
MTNKNFQRYSRSGLKRALYVGVSAGVLGSAALAQVTQSDPPVKLQTDYFGYGASVTARVGYSDNINLGSEGQEDDDIILSTSFSGGLITSTNRFTGLVLGDLDFSFLADDGDFRVNQNVGGTGTATIAENWLYFDVSGQTSRQLVGDNARFSGNLNAGRGERTDVHSFSLSPYVYHQFADQSSASLRYRFSQVFVDGDGDGGFLDLGLDDSTSHEAIAQYSSGGLLNRARFVLSAYGNSTEQGEDNFFPIEYQQGSFTGQGEFALTPRFSLSGAVGYDEVDTDGIASLFFDDDELSGVFWRAGFTARPNRRARVRIEYGQRYDDDFIDADVSYQITQRLNFRAGANRTFQTRTRNISGRFQEVQTQTLLFADQLREGGEASPRSVINNANQFASTLTGFNAQTIGVGVINQAFVALSGRYDRSNWALSGAYIDSDFGFREIESFDITGNFNRRLSRRLNGYARAFYRRADTTVDPEVCIANPQLFGFDVSDPDLDLDTDCMAFADGTGVTNTLGGTVGASYRVYENVSAFGEYTYTNRFSPVEALEFEENAVFIGLTLDF